MRPSKLSISSQKKILWRVFSLYIRLRDTNDEGVGRCISCGKFVALGGNLQAGHYYPRGNTYASLYFDEKNVNGQCVHCNHFLEGNKQGYAIGLKKKYGPAVLEELDITKSRKKFWDVFIYVQKIKEYRAKNREMAKRKTVGVTLV